MIEIRCAPVRDAATIRVPGSKSMTHRMVIAAAFSDGKCTVDNYLDSDDTRYTVTALEQLGVDSVQTEDRLIVHGRGGILAPNAAPIFLGNSGTSMRLLTAVVALGRGPYRLEGTDRMHQRPIQPLLDALRQLGVSARSVNGDGCPPVAIHADGVRGGDAAIDCATSSQFLSGLLLMAPGSRQGLTITVTNGPVSKPYVDMTLQVLSRFGIAYERNDYEWFRVGGPQFYQAGAYTVEPDASQASYFWAAAALTGATVRVDAIPKDSLQGDLRILERFEAMGCRILRDDRGVAVTGGPLTGIDTDMRDLPDMVPTLAVVAAFADGPTRIRNVAHLRLKESDRLLAVRTGLGNMGIEAVEAGDDLIVHGGHPAGAPICPYDDHRIAMSFSVAGLKVPGVRIEDETCVAKSFPGFWQAFDGLYAL